MLAKDHSPYRNRALEKTVEERDTARKELIARIEQVAQLTADCRGYRERLEWWKKLAEDRQELLVPVVVQRDALRELVKHIQDALGTGEEGENLVEVARNAHHAEMELAAIRRGGE